MNKFDNLYKQIINEEKDYITVDLKLKLQNGDSYTTSFNISNKFLEDQTPLEVAKKYFLGKPYTYSDETSSKIVSVELLDSKIQEGQENDKGEQSLKDALTAIRTQAKMTYKTFPNAPGREDWLSVIKICDRVLGETDEYGFSNKMDREEQLRTRLG